MFPLRPRPACVRGSAVRSLLHCEEGTRGRFYRSAGCTLAVQPRELSQHCLLVPSSLRFESWPFKNCMYVPNRVSAQTFKDV